MGATHDTNINVQIVLDAAAPAQAGFGIAMLVAEVAGYDAQTDPRTLSFTSSADVATALDAGEVSSTAAAILNAALAQQPRPATVKLGRKEELESYTDALTAIEAEDPTWYGVAIESRLAADIVAVAQWVETRPRLFIAQSSDTDWLTSGVPAGFTALEVLERTALIFHTTDTEGADFAWLANRLAFDPDTFSAPWDTRIFGVQSYDSNITAGQREAAFANNANLMLPYGPVQTFVDPGINVGNRPIYELITRDWFQLRLEQKIAQAKINASARGTKIPLGQQGISILRPLVESQFSEGVAAGHFVDGQTEVTFFEPTQADIDLQRIRATGRAQLAVGARIFDFNFNFQRTPINEEDAA